MIIKKNKVFLGGSITSDWRLKLIPLLDIDYFNPVVDEWNESFRLLEEEEKRDVCNIHFYMIDSTMTGKYSFVEIGISAGNKDIKTILQINPDGFDDKELDNLESIINLVTENKGLAYFDSGYEYLATILNN